MALHALAYCERLFYLEEVGGIRIADEAVYAGRRLHERLRWEIERILDKADSLIIASLCQGCAKKVIARNPSREWGEEEPLFRIV